jgi:mannitol/fructose-specific phosphotransferase system IIA component (Ntr-type)
MPSNYLLIWPVCKNGFRGVSDTSTDKPIEFIFLILSPAETPDTQVQVLGLASRAAQNRHLLQGLRSAQTPEEVFMTLRSWEMEREKLHQ